MLINCCPPTETFLFIMLYKFPIRLKLGKQTGYYMKWISLKPMLFRGSLVLSTECDGTLSWIKIIFQKDSSWILDPHVPSPRIPPPKTNNIWPSCYLSITPYKTQMGRSFTTDNPTPNHHTTFTLLTVQTVRTVSASSIHLAQ